MDPKGYEKKPWFPYLKNMYDEIEGDMMSVDAKGYEEKPWWPYVLDLQKKIDAGGGGGEKFVVLPEQEINAVKLGANPYPGASINLPFTPVRMTVFYDGTAYDTKRAGLNGEYTYGAASLGDFSEFPFRISQSGTTWYIYTQTAGHHTISAEMELSSFSVATVTLDFTLPGAVGVDQTSPGLAQLYVDANLPGMKIEQVSAEILNNGTKIYALMADGEAVLMYINISGKMTHGLPKTYVLPEDGTGVILSGNIRKEITDGYATYIITGDCGIKAELVQGS